MTERPEMSIDEARSRLEKVVRASAKSQGSFGGFSIYTTGLPEYDGRNRDTRALSVSGLNLSNGFGVTIALVELDEEDDETRLTTINIFDREELTFLRDALARLLDDPKMLAEDEA